MIFYTYDLEIFGDFFCAVFKNYITKEYEIFEISTFKDDRARLIRFIEHQSLGLIGYNSVDFDDQLLYHIILHPNDTVEQYKEAANSIITAQWGLYAPWVVEKYIDQSLDIMQILNMGIRSAKTTSLKKWEFNLRKKSIKDLPVHHTSLIRTRSVADAIIKYCCYDVDVTEEIFDLNKDQLRMRQDLGSHIGMNLLNLSEVTLSKKIITKVFSEKLKMDEKDFKAFRTYRDEIKVKDILHIKRSDFKVKEHLALYDYYESQVLEPTRKSNVKKDKKVFSLNTLNYNIKYYNGLESEYGSGGLHGVVKPGIYRETDEYCLVDADFASFYPHLIAIFYLECGHLPKGMLGSQLMEWYNDRKTKYPKKTHFTLNYSYKILMNLTYGLMGSEYSPFFDQQAQLGVCINGMLQLTKITELAFLNGAEVLYQNTDGILFRCKRIDRDKIVKILTDYGDNLGIELETVGVKKLVLNDVNNFLLVDQYDNVKEKGLFETYDTITKQKMYHKDTSAMIIPKALKEYFVNGVSIEDTINNENDIYNFCMGVKGGSNFVFCEQKSDDDGHIQNKIHYVRMMRYYASTRGVTLYKLWKPTSKKKLSFSSVEATTQVTLAQTVRKTEIYDYMKNGSIKIRYNSDGKIVHRYPTLKRKWYIDKTQKIIDNILGIESI